MQNDKNHKKNVKMSQRKKFRKEKILRKHKKIPRHKSKWCTFINLSIYFGLNFIKILFIYFNFLLHLVSSSSSIISNSSSKMILPSVTSSIFNIESDDLIAKSKSIPGWCFSKCFLKWIRWVNCRLHSSHLKRKFFVRFMTIVIEWNSVPELFVWIMN